MSEFHDPDLRQELGRLSGPYPDDNVAFAAWQRRVGQARRRRAVAWTMAAAMLLVVGTVAVAALQSPTRHSLVPGKSAETSEDFTVSVPETDADDSSVVATEAPETSVTTLAPDTTSSSEVETESSVPETEGTEAAGAPSGGGSTKNHGGSQTPVAPATPAGTQSFTSAGGTITVHQDGDQLSIVSVSPAAGFHAKQDDHSGDKVQVTFKSADRQVEVTVKVVNGVMKQSVSEQNDASHQDSVPDNTSGDHGGGNNNG